VNVSASPPAAASNNLGPALHAAARPLVALATQLRQAAVQAPANMAGALAGAVSRFEHELAEAGWDERGVAAASYLLCVWVDEVVADTPWGAGGAGLLERFHGERDGGERVLRLLSRLAEQAPQNRALLELFHTCLSLGLTGRLRSEPDPAQRVDLLRSRVFQALPTVDPALAPPWRSALPPPPRALPQRVAIASLVTLGLAALGVYTASHLALAARVDGVFASMQQLSAASPGLAGAASAEPAASPRLAPALAADAAAGLLTVRDEANRSVVALPADALFENGSTQLSATGAAVLARVAAVLVRTEGKVAVIGHTDGNDIRNARMPSAWHQSYEWARVTAGVLGRSVNAERLMVEGAADLPAPGQAAAPRRRVEIVLYP